MKLDSLLLNVHHYVTLLIAATNVKPATTTVTQAESVPEKVQASTKPSVPKVTEKPPTTSTVVNVPTTKTSSKNVKDIIKS